MKIHWKFFLISVTVFMLFSCSNNTNEPNKNDIIEVIELELPVYFDLNNFKIEVTENIGNKIEPVVRSRFKANVVTKMPLFIKQKELLKKDVLKEVTSKGKTYQAYGISVSAFTKDMWLTKIEKVEITPEVLGLPLLNWKDGSYVISGSKEEKKLIKNKKANDLAREKRLKEMGLDIPEGAFMAVIESIKQNDVKSLMQVSMSKDEYNKAVAKFENEKMSPSESDKAQFEQMMGMLTLDGAVDQLMAMATPQLEQARAQLPMLLMMGKGMASSAIQASPDIPADQKEASTMIINAIMDFAGENDILSEEVTRKAISAAVATAKSLNMKSLDELQNMSFDDAMGKAGLVMGGVKNVMGAYGISLDDVLNSIDVSDVQTNGDNATMKVAYKFLDKTFNQNVKMVKKDGKWIADK